MSEREWQPVANPPNTRRWVLIWNGLHEEIQIGEYVPDEQRWNGTYGTDDGGDITHWMSLPLPPSGEVR